ncbi:MAG: SDR family oxidoreductase [Nitrospinae bacterium]|nr:SDR family oxidoreductase [Nitrospinota bacterium]
MSELTGRIALVTGGGSGIGRATALVFARAGADLIINDISPERAEGVASEVADLGRKALAIPADVADLGAVEAMAGQALKSFGKVDIVVNNAGIGVEVPFHKMSKEEWERMFAVHVGGTFHCTRSLLPQMMERRWGRIISISSVAGLMGEVGLVHYSAAKAAILGFTKALAREMASYGITVNAIAPGLIDTPLARSIQPELWQKFVSASPVGHEGKPEDIAHACAYLASEGASFVTGQVLSPNGGIWM